MGGRRRSRSTSCAALVHRVGYSIGYSSGAPRLRHVHDVRFELFMRRRSISRRYLHSDRKSVTNAGDLQNVTVTSGFAAAWIHGSRARGAGRHAARWTSQVFGATGQTVVAAPTELSRGPADGWTSRAPPATLAETATTPVHSARR